MPELRDLSYADCERLLESGVVGRVAVATPQGPHIVPISYSYIDGQIVFRTTPYSVLGTYGCNSNLAFETDHVNFDDHTGWSVVVRGRGDVVTDTEELQRIKDGWPQRPWASGGRHLYFRLIPQEISGRRLGSEVSTERDTSAPVVGTV